jgi:hypothetical protein
MTNKIRKPRENFTPDQRLEYAKLMVEEGYSNQQVISCRTTSYWTRLKI